jgi:ubiquinone/menaquinone biosynthesis C-methylase UbiE
VSLASEYRRQFRWREWPTVLGALPPLEGTTILDLGCGVGDVAAELVARGARVVGIDMNEKLIREARSRKLPTAEFRTGDLREKLNLDLQADGLWCGFTAAYFPDLPLALDRWARHLRPGGWIAVTEVDDLFGHEPLEAQTKALLNAYAEEALAAGRYDFRMGRKLEGHLRRAGFVVSRVLTLADQELSFSGRAQPEVLEAWRNRFARMTLLRSFCGARMLQVEEEFIRCLGREDHRSLAKVYCCIAGTKAPRA